MLLPEFLNKKGFRELDFRNSELDIINKNYFNKLKEEAFDCELNNGNTLRTALSNLLINIHEIGNPPTIDYMHNFIGGESGLVLAPSKHKYNESLIYNGRLSSTLIEEEDRHPCGAGEICEITGLNEGNQLYKNKVGAEYATTCINDKKIKDYKYSAKNINEAGREENASFYIEELQEPLAFEDGTKHPKATGGGNRNLKNSYRTIINPITNRKLKLNTKSGKNLLQNFLNQQ